SRIHFVAPDGADHPLMVTEKYLRERPNWTIEPCNKCGLTELFDAPSNLRRVVFPNLPQDAVLQCFTAFCGCCGGIQLVRQKDGQMEGAPPRPAEPKKKWWQFWK